MTKEEELNELLNNLNNYMNYRTKLITGHELWCKFIYENGNYYVVNKQTQYKVLISSADICNYIIYVIDVNDPKMADIIYSRIDKINKKYENY